MARGGQDNANFLLYHSLPYPVESGLSLNMELSRQSGSPSDPPVSALHSIGISNVYKIKTGFSLCGAMIKTWVLMVMLCFLYLVSHLSAITLKVFKTKKSITVWIDSDKVVLIRKNEVDL